MLDTHLKIEIFLKINTATGIASVSLKISIENLAFSPDFTWQRKMLINAK